MGNEILNPDEGFETRELPKFIQFGDGDYLEGVLIAIEKATAKGKACTRYTVLKTGGDAVSFLGTNQLDRKLRQSDLGHRVKICCTGSDPNVQKGNNAMKLFDVKVSNAPVPNAPLLSVHDTNPEITDADIPF